MAIQLPSLLLELLLELLVDYAAAAAGHSAD
ncbi:hypothetical protein SAMN05216217_101176 [Halopseudomonas yangmingensis]|uniref:Uncharacterized protein n=1 Tax=Halopseudomonas yangmingensis TaxID=1720063 RepID=A0A1I4NB73_9GAMM|nr:hypothetical protein SAMN05216217_101176 [Halopseudomonas yangmingensis]